MAIDQNTIKEILSYCPQTGDFHWRHRGENWFKSVRAMNAWNSKNAGKKAGCLKVSKNGYACIFIRIMKRPYYAHRLAWLYMTGEQPPEMLDHENRDATDNRWSNIRDPEGANQRNLSKMSSNTSGVTGVHWYEKRGKWQAYSHYKGKRYHLGYFTDKESAKNAVLDFRSTRDFSADHGLKYACYKRQ